MNYKISPNPSLPKRGTKRELEEEPGVFGSGIDIEELSRFDKYTENNDYSFMENYCTEHELINLCDDNRVRFALSFSCKEAFFKALGESWTNSNILWTDIELLFDGPGFDNYRVLVHNYAKELLEKNNAGIGETSFDYNEEFVMFQVILLHNHNDHL
ncbi:MAG: 4'-phosphopantetheinyl transferase superfamily protein [Nitrospirota bacterium]